MIKKTAFIFALIFINACALHSEVAVAEEEDFEVHKLVIQMNKNDKALQAEVLSNIVNISKFYGIDNVEIELVAYGPGIYFLSKESSFRKRIESLMFQEVTFTACGDTINTIKRDKGIDIKLIEGVTVVHNGIPRMMDLQEQGYSYLSP